MTPERILLSVSKKVIWEDSFRDNERSDSGRHSNEGWHL